MKKLALLLMILLVCKVGYAEEKRLLPERDLIYLKFAVQDPDKEVVNQIKVKLLSALCQDREEVVLTEAGKNSGVFRAEKGIKLLAREKIIQDGILQVSTGPDIIYVLYPEGPNKEKVLATLTTLPAIAKFSVAIDSAIQTAGRPFPVEIIANDRQNNVLVDYAGTVNIEAGGVRLLTASSFVNGVARVSVTYPETGRVKIAAKDLNQKAGKSNPVFFLPAKFKIEAIQPLPYTVGKEFALKVTALNAQDEVTSGYEGPATIEPLGNRASSRGSIFFNQGIAEAKVTYNQWGERRFVVCDKKHRDIRGITQNLFFVPHSFKVEIKPAPADRKKFYFEELFKGRVSVLDYRGNLIPEYAGVVVFEPIKDVDMPQEYYFDWRNRGEAVFFLSGVKDKAFKVKVSDALFCDARGESDPVTLMPAQIKTQLLEIKENKAKVKIKIADEEGRVIAEDNSTVFSVQLVEDNPDESAYLAGPKKIKARNGQAFITVADKEKESVEAFVESEPYLDAEPCQINFGE